MRKADLNYSLLTSIDGVDFIGLYNDMIKSFEGNISSSQNSFKPKYFSGNKNAQVEGLTSRKIMQQYYSSYINESVTDINSGQI